MPNNEENRTMPLLINLGFCLGKIEKDDNFSYRSRLTIVSPSFSEVKHIPAESVVVCGTDNLKARRDALLQVFPLEKAES